jgi:PTH1 family peptidyl-tRNA hydrolase
MMQFFRRLFKDMTEDQNTYLIAGLGNPGRKYANNRHNIGFMLMDRLAEHLQVNFSRVESKALVTRSKFGENRLILIKPQTFMNNSGRAVASLARYYKVPLENLLVAYDDLDLDLGTIRLRPQGGSGGHKGIASVIQELGTQNFSRLRLGIGRPPGRMEAADYVLRDFSSSEREIIAVVLELGVEAVLTFINQGIESAMNEYNRNLLEK